MHAICMAADALSSCSKLWNASGLLDPLVVAGSEADAVAQEITVALKTVLNGLVSKQRRMSISNLLNADGADYLKPSSEAALAQNIVLGLQGEVKVNEISRDAGNYNGV